MDPSRTVPLSAPPGFKPNQRAQATDHIRHQKRQMRRAIFARRGSYLLNFALGGAVLCFAYATPFLFPLVRVVPVYLPPPSGDGAQPAGAPVVPYTVSSQMPPVWESNQIEATLWQFVLCHEGYNFGGAQYCWDVVTGMSTPDVYLPWQAANSAKNKNAPINVLGRGGSKHLTWEGARLTQNRDDDTGTYEVSYYRTVLKAGEAPVTTHWRVALAYSQRYVVPRWMARTINPSSLLVTAHAAPDQIGARPGTPVDLPPNLEIPGR